MCFVKEKTSSLVEIGLLVMEKNIKMWKVHRQTNEQTDNNRQSWKLTCIFSSGELTRRGAWSTWMLHTWLNYTVCPTTTDINYRAIEPGGRYGLDLDGISCTVTLLLGGNPVFENSKYPQVTLFWNKIITELVKESWH